MANTIDGEARRLLLAEATWRLIVRGGLRAASVRNVAAEANLATGSVRHFFPAQADLHNFAMTELIAVVTRRIQRAARTAGPDPAERVRRMLLELLPITDRTHAEFAAYLDFLQHARLDPALGDVARDSVRAVRELIVSLLSDLRDLGRLRPGVDVATEAIRLHAFIDGLTLQLIAAPELTSRGEARAALAAWLHDLDTTGATADREASP